MALGQGGIANADSSAKARGLLQKVHWHFSCACKSMHQKPFMHAAVSQDVTDVEDMLMATLDTLPTTPGHHTQDLLTQVSTANQFQSEAEFTQR